MKKDKDLICIYHRADLDGKCSLEIVRKRFPQTIPIGVNYGDDIPSFREGSDVILVDFCFEPHDLMLKLKEKADTFVWIDHHQTAIDWAEKNGFDVPGIRESGEKAACELTWEFLFPDTEVPKAVWYLSRYDTWQNHLPEWETEILPFQYAMRNTPFNFNWDYVFESNSQWILSKLWEGRIILNYIRQNDRIYASTYAFETEVDGLRAIACNTGLRNSMLFDSVYDPEKHDLMILFCRKNGKWKVSFYTTKDEVRCDKIAEKYGGGGHHKAAGTIVDELPFRY